MQIQPVQQKRIIRLARGQAIYGQRQGAGCRKRGNLVQIDPAPCRPVATLTNDGKSQRARVFHDQRHRCDSLYPYAIRKHRSPENLASPRIKRRKAGRRRFLRQNLKPGDGNERSSAALGQGLCDTHPNPHSGERPGPAHNRESVEFLKAPATTGQNRSDCADQSLRRTSPW